MCQWNFPSMILFKYFCHHHPTICCFPHFARALTVIFCMSPASRSPMLLFDYGFRYLFSLRLFVYLLNAMHVLRIQWLLKLFKNVQWEKSKNAKQTTAKQQNGLEREGMTQRWRERERVVERERKSRTEGIRSTNHCKRRQTNKFMMI